MSKASSPAQVSLPPDVADPRSTSPVTGKKSSKTCCTCRARKVRCDGRRSICSNCERLGFTCSYDESSAEAGGIGPDGITNFALPRRRVRHACVNCHTRKARCSGTTPKCVRCLIQGLQCVYRPTKRTRPGSGAAPRLWVASVGEGYESQTLVSGGDPRKNNADREMQSLRQAESHRGSASSDPSSKASQNVLVCHETLHPPESLVTRVLDSFFRHVHQIPVLSFFHRASLMQRHRNGVLDRPLLLALIGITSILVDLGPENKQYGDKCIDEAESLIFADLEKPSTVKVQALALIIKHRWASGRFSSAFMLLGIASRFAVVLRLNHEQPHLCFLAQESRRRLMWALYMMDSGAAGGYEDFAQWSAERVRLQLPCNERNFEFDLPQKTEGLVPPPQPMSEDLGNLALHVRVFWLRSKTVAFGRKAIRASTHQELAALPSEVAALHQELNAFNQRLQASFKYTKNNLRLRMYSPRLCVFVMVHIWWRQCHMDLYRFAIQGIIEALPKEVMGRCDPAFLTLCRQRCVEHASAMSDIFRDMLELDTGIPVTDLDLPVCAYQSARLLHYAYRMSATELGMSAQDVITRSERCLCMVKASCNGCPAAKSVQLDLERLIQHGPSLESAPSASSSSGLERADHEPGRAPGRVHQASSRHSLVRQLDVVDDSGIGAPPGPEEKPPDVLEDQGDRAPSIHSGVVPKPVTISAQMPSRNPQQGCMAMTNGLDLDNGFGMDVQTGKPVEAPIQQVTSEGMPSIDLTSQNNAFEGALDGFNLSMEPFRWDSFNWLSSAWPNSEYALSQQKFIG